MVSGWIQLQIPLVVPMSITCQKCKTEFRQLGQSQLLKCQCGHIISMTVVLEKQEPNKTQELAKARNVLADISARQAYLDKIRKTAPVG